MSSMNKKKTLSRRGKQILHKEGFFSLLRHVALFLGGRIVSYNKQYLYEEKLDDDVSVPQCKLNNFTIKPLFIPTMTQLEYEALGEEFYDFPSHPSAKEYVSEYREEADKGMLILYVTINGEFVHRNAVTFSGRGGAYENLQKKLRSPFYSLDDKQIAYRSLCVTNPKYRGKRIYTHFEFEMHNYMRKIGFSKLVFTARSNLPIDFYIFDNILNPKMGAEAKYKVYYITLLKRFNYTLIRPCTKQPLDELGLSRSKWERNT